MNTAYYKTILLNQKTAMEETLAKGEEAAQPVELDQTMQGRVSRIDAIQQQEMQKAAQARREQELEKIKAALARIETGDYGYCTKCDEEIDEKRLDLDPATPLCINCA